MGGAIRGQATSVSQLFCHRGGCCRVAPCLDTQIAISCMIAGDLNLLDGADDLWNMFGSSTPSGVLPDLMSGLSNDQFDLSHIIKQEPTL